MDSDQPINPANAPVDRTRISDTIQGILADLLEIDVSKVRPESNLETDLGADSLLFLELFEELRSEFKFKLDLHQIAKYARTQKVATVGELSEVVACYLEKGDELLRELDA